MEITDAQYRQIEPCLPTQRGNVTLDNLHVLNAILYVAEQGGKWRGLPKRFGNWHTIYTRMNRWSKSGVLDRVFAQLQHTQIIRVKIEAVAMDDQDSYGCRGCSNGHNVCPVPGPGPRCARGAQAAATRRENAAPDPPVDGSGV